MGNRSKYVAVGTAAAAGALAARRRARLRRAADAVQDTILPTRVMDLRTEPAPSPGEGGAPGHQHRRPDTDEPAPVVPPPRQGKHAHGMTHPAADR